MSEIRRARAIAAAERSSRAKWRPGPTEAQKRESELVTIAAGGCWCGEPYGHDWPGKSDGAPHPR